MKTFSNPLNKNQLNYVLFHLQLHIEFDEELKKRMHYCLSTANIDDGIIFRSSTRGIDLTERIQYNNKQLPNLFPAQKQLPLYEWQNGNLVFHHDLLKAAFYLLSAYQETLSSDKDTMGRFQYKNSVQYQTDCVQIPVVNYYFDIIADGIEHFCKKHHLSCKRKRLFNDFGFMLTHDVDRIDYYHWRETTYKLLQLVGLKKAHYNKRRLLKASISAIIPTLFPGTKQDPWWNFDELRRIEKELQFKSVWYFLNRDGSPHDAKYHLEEKRIKKLISQLLKDKCEVGLHGSISTATDSTAMRSAKTRMDQAAGQAVIGIRQHFLKFQYPDTLKRQEDAGLLYDTTMGFAEHEGFRNSYCYPFKPYDHQNNRMLDIWEIPLTVMDTTLFGYRNLDYNNMHDSFNYLINEIKQFGGVLVLLWHNCNFDEAQYPGIKQYYTKQLEAIVDKGPTSITGTDLIEQLRTY